jgi:hypothetical protein
MGVKKSGRAERASERGISAGSDSLCCDSTLIENDEIPIQMVMKYLGNPIKIK